MSGEFLIYEDPLITMRLSSKPSVRGHVEVRPVRQVKTLQELDDKIVEHLFFGASYAATALFELVGAQGTNIILNEDDEQLCIHVLARSENDGVNFLWEPHKADASELKDVSKNIRDKADVILYNKDNPQGASSSAPKTVASNPAAVIKPEEGKENYLLKSLRRVP